MKSKNAIEIIGYLGADPRTTRTQSGSQVTTFSVATTERWTGKDDNPKEHTEWHRCVFFGPHAVQIAEKLRKGHLVQVEGALRSRSYEKDGVTRTVVEIRGRDYRDFASARADNAAMPPDAGDARDEAPVEDDLPV
jgi:single-strand DNA-binding protein